MNGVIKADNIYQIEEIPDFVKKFMKDGNECYRLYTDNFYLVTPKIKTFSGFMSHSNWVVHYSLTTTVINVVNFINENIPKDKKYIIYRDGWNSMDLANSLLYDGDGTLIRRFKTDHSFFLEKTIQGFKEILNRKLLSANSMTGLTGICKNFPEIIEYLLFIRDFITYDCLNESHGIFFTTPPREDLINLLKNDTFSFNLTYNKNVYNGSEYITNTLPTSLYNCTIHRSQNYIFRVNGESYEIVQGEGVNEPFYSYGFYPDISEYLLHEFKPIRLYYEETSSKLTNPTPISSISSIIEQYDIKNDDDRKYHLFYYKYMIYKMSNLVGVRNYTLKPDFNDSEKTFEQLKESDFFKNSIGILGNESSEYFKDISQHPGVENLNKIITLYYEKTLNSLTTNYYFTINDASMRYILEYNLENAKGYEEDLDRIYVRYTDEDIHQGNKPCDIYPTLYWEIYKYIKIEEIVCNLTKDE